ncbi:hypothetical protein J6590_062315 [Homalodisca vitripennis]|nr:hypothetical protein J6590_062315 [Homalodisca vitripennis]
MAGRTTARVERLKAVQTSLQSGFAFGRSRSAVGNGKSCSKRRLWLCTFKPSDALINGFTGKVASCTFVDKEGGNNFPTKRRYGGDMQPQVGHVKSVQRSIVCHCRHTVSGPRVGELRQAGYVKSVEGSFVCHYRHTVSGLGGGKVFRGVK